MLCHVACIPYRCRLDGAREPTGACHPLTDLDRHVGDRIRPVSGICAGATEQ